MPVCADLSLSLSLSVLRTLDAEHLIDLELDGQAVAVPAEAALDVVAGLVRVPADDVLRPAARAHVSLGRSAEGGQCRAGTVSGWRRLP